MMLDSGKLRVKDRVKVQVDGREVQGTVKYVGPVHSEAFPGDWVGVELDSTWSAQREGSNGSISNIEYFKCEPHRGVFVKPRTVKAYGQEGELRPEDVIESRRPAPAPAPAPAHSAVYIDDRSGAPHKVKAEAPEPKPRAATAVSGAARAPDRDRALTAPASHVHGHEPRRPAASSTVSRGHPNNGVSSAPTRTSQRDAVRRQLVEAAEHHDWAQLRAVLPKAQQLGVPPSEIQAARRLLELEASGVPSDKSSTGGSPAQPSRGHARTDPAPARGSRLDGDRGERLPPYARNPFRSDARSGLLDGVLAEGAAGGFDLADGGTGADFIERMVRFLSRQDQRFTALEARVRRLESGEGPDGGGTAAAALCEPAAAPLGAGLPASLAEAVQGVESRLVQHEAALKLLGNTVEQATTQMLSREAERRVAFIEGRLDALWSTLQGERLFEGYDAEQMRSRAGSRVQPGEDTPVRGGRDRGSSKSETALSRQTLKRAFDSLSDGRDWLATDRLEDFFAELGFVVEDVPKLSKVLDSKKTGKVSFKDLLSNLEAVPQ